MVNKNESLSVAEYADQLWSASISGRSCSGCVFGCFFLFPLEDEGIGCRRNREFRATPLVRCFAAGLLLFLDDVTASPHTRFEMSDLANL